MSPEELQIWYAAFASFAVPDRPARDAAEFAAAKVHELRNLKPGNLSQDAAMFLLQARGGR
jgi:hypothetical protein